MRRRARTRGGALLAAVAALAFSAALGAALVDLARVEIRLASERRFAARLLAAADGCLADAVAALPAGWDFGPLLDGADGVPGTADDGAVPAPAGCAAQAAAAPGPAAPDRVVVRVAARLPPRERRVEAVVRRAAAAGADALLWLTAPPAGAGIAGLVSLDGADAAAPHAALAAPVDPEALDAWVAAQGAALALAPGTAAPVAAPPPPLAALGARVLAAPHAGAEALGAAPPAAPVVAHIAGDLRVDNARHGAGLLFVDGVLDVRGALVFAGVVVATGGVRVAAGAALALDGALWVGGAPALDVAGTAVVRRAAGAVAAADAMLALPRRAVVAGARDVG